jgi:hypothetical protein
MQITRKSLLSGTERTRDIDVTAEQWAAYLGGKGLIQNIMPNVSVSDREFIMTGITDEEWETLKTPE